MALGVRVHVVRSERIFLIDQEMAIVYCFFLSFRVSLI